MRELTEAVIGFPWALFLFGGQQLANMLPLRPSAASPHPVEAALDTVAHAAVSQLGDLYQVAFQTGDQLQRTAMDRGAGFLTLQVLHPGQATQQMAEVLQPALNAGRLLLSPQASWTAYQELLNKIQVYFLVQDVESALAIHTSQHMSLQALTEQAYDRDMHSALWAVEGLGRYYGEQIWQHEDAPQGLLSGHAASQLPEKSLSMLHAGVGLSFAKKLLRPLSPQSSRAEIRDVLHRLDRLIHDNFQEGYIGAAYESLGLVARTFHPRLVDVLDAVLGDVAPDVSGCYWHGVGRALYFFPTYFLPGLGLPWQAVTHEAPHELARLNALAGLTYAAVMVNLRHPAIIAALLYNHAEQLTADGAFANGVAASVMARYDTTPDAPFVKFFYQYQPDPSIPGLAALWNAYVTIPCEQALTHYYPVLKAHRRLDEMAQYQPWSSSVARLHTR